MSELRATYSGCAGAWHGVVKDDAGTVLYQCEHSHRTRTSCVSCAELKAKELDPAYVFTWMRWMQ